MLTTRGLMFVLIAFSAAVACFAEAGPGRVPDCAIGFEKVKDALTVRALAPASYHFNRQAPTELLVPETKKTFKPAQFKGRIVEFSVTGSENLRTGTEFAAHLYICDDAETTCIPQRLKFSWRGEKKADASPEGPPKGGPSTTGRDANGFILNDSVTALITARREHKPVLIVFSTIWCPNCNQLEEELFPTPEFQSVARGFVLLHVDGDAQVSWELKSRYAVAGYPTLVLTTPTGEEIGRGDWSDSPRLVFLMRKALANPEIGFGEFKRRADDGDASAAQEVGEMLFARSQFGEAEKYLWRASDRFGPKSAAAESLLWARISRLEQKDAEKTAEERRKLLESATAYFPKSPRLLDAHRSLAKLYKAKNETAKRKAELAGVVSAALKLLSDRPARESAGRTVEGLWVLIAAARLESGDEKGSEEAYAEAVGAVRARIAQLGPKNPARGSHLILAEILAQSGEIPEAREICQEYQARYPGDVTFFWEEADILGTLRQWAEAEPKAVRALELSYGDNRLRIAKNLAEIRARLGCKTEAVQVIDQTLKEFDRPRAAQTSVDPMKVRTGSLIKELRELKKQIQHGTFRSSC